MSWRESSGRESCNHCRRAVDLGAPLYVGEYAPAFWCLDCAAEALGKSPEGPCPKVRAVGDMDAFNPKLMGAKLRHAILTRRGGAA